MSNFNLTTTYSNVESSINAVLVEARFFGVKSVSFKEMEGILRNIVNHELFVENLVRCLEDSHWTDEKIPACTLKPNFDVKLVEVEHGTQANVVMTMVLSTRYTDPTYLKEAFTSWITSWFFNCFEEGSNSIVINSYNLNKCVIDLMNANFCTNLSLSDGVKVSFNS